ncbi:MAG TPA: M55 family metallopeptidase [Candidatus Marinimicrobia bacterium]|jgi:D-amino peptidase|nr:M55 family metallopeptidase [Candidatus Neomarinimicrobiota bacterium]MDP7437278.1 M55 family metallopeptidase [Candidatus Neomarinimicrobiota bacterium]MDP7653544.1 M55 family metallopeptidase [Candidatus Neomarinimicrobiota bacterium]HJL84702.1 M55 family metallopeptidase [Candidatus Neomarinimicrobiota bacterium]|tara:strand:- start:334 stop:1215 length:882 start_codon:yes stop_codon:yes gene_type:complete
MKKFITLLTISFIWAADGPKIYISSDMEGVVGAVTGEQMGPSGFEYQQFREFMTAEVNAAIEGARSAGAGEILVADSHGNGQNLLIDKLPKDVKIVRSWPRPLDMVGGLDDSFDGIIFLGYHASSDNLTGVRAHTFSSGRLTSVKLNGMPVTEGAWNAAIAGELGVPVIMVSGDDAAVEEVSSLVGNVEGAVVKWALSFHSATTLQPDAAYDLIRDKAARAVKNIKKYKPYKVKNPVTVEMGFKNYRPVEILNYLSLFERTSSHTIRFSAKTMEEAAQIITFVLMYGGGSSTP